MKQVGRKLADTVGDHFIAAVGRKIRREREKQELTVKDAADKTGGVVGRTTWRSYERGMSEPSLSKYMALCTALGVPFTKFLKG